MHVFAFVTSLHTSRLRGNTVFCLKKRKDLRGGRRVADDLPLGYKYGAQAKKAKYVLNVSRYRLHSLRGGVDNAAHTTTTTTSPNLHAQLIKMGCAPSAPPKPPAPKYQVPAAAMHRNPPQPGAYSQYHDQARAAFTQGDANRDGVLDAQELYGVLVRLGLFNGVPPQHINAMMEAELQKADRHTVDRLITFEEFLPYFEYLMQELQKRGAQIRPPAAPTQYYGQPGYGVHRECAVVPVPPPQP